MRPNIDPPESVSDAKVIEHNDPGDTHEGGGFQTEAPVTEEEVADASVTHGPNDGDDTYRLNLKEDAEDGGDDVNESGDDYGGAYGQDK